MLDVWCFQGAPPPPRKQSVGDLIKLDGGRAAVEDPPGEVIFDPLLEGSSATKSDGQQLSHRVPMMPHPPSTSTLPLLVSPNSNGGGSRGGGGKVRDMVNSINTSNPFSPPPQGTQAQAPAGGNLFNHFQAPIVNSLGAVGGSPQRIAQSKSRAAITKSSDDLLKSYGLDFSKLSTGGSGGGSNGPSAADPFADLDPLGKSRPAAGAGEDLIVPEVPTRAKRHQQNWTTFE